MKAEEIIRILDVRIKIPRRWHGLAVRGISCNSKEVRRGFIFVAVKGTHMDGARFIGEAVRDGAKIIIAESAAGVPQDRVFFIKVKNVRRALARLAAKFYGHPSKKIKVVGITGTNGKTTVSYLLEAIIKNAGFQPAVIGTVNYRFKNKIIPSHNTTPGPCELQPLLADMSRRGTDYAIMEVSSHALDQERTEGIDFHSAVFTNLTQDHLDYHKTLKNYFQAKLRLFKNLPLGAFAVINNDDAYARRIKKTIRGRRVITYGMERKSEVMAEDLKYAICHTEFILKAQEKKTRLKIRLIGRHNVYNVLAAFAWGLKAGLKPSVIKSAIKSFSFVPGRLQRLPTAGGFCVFVDYAHTEDALKNVLEALRGLPHKRIIVVFGCGGDRDKSKRPKMGRVASELADYAIITSDNPRSEEPLQIIKDIKRGIKRNNYCVIPQRKEAIKKSLSLAGKQDIVLIAGKGHENYQVFKSKTVHFNDREVVKACLKSKNC